VEVKCAGYQLVSDASISLALVADGNQQQVRAPRAGDEGGDGIVESAVERTLTHEVAHAR
jgi:hypothetical protein